MPNRRAAFSAGARPGPRGVVREVSEARSEYASARTIGANIEHRRTGSRLSRHPGYLPPEVDYLLADGSARTISVRDCDVRYLDRVPRDTALDHIELIHGARLGDRDAARELDRRLSRIGEAIAARFSGRRLTDNEFVIPYTSAGAFTEAEVSHKGAMLLGLSQRGFATSDFVLLSAHAYSQPPSALDRSVRDAIGDLEMLTGRRVVHSPQAESGGSC